MSLSRLVVVIEDNPADVRLIKEAIRESGLHLRLQSFQEADTPALYLKREGTFGDAERPSLILLDLNVPGGSSRDLLRVIKSDPDLRAIPVIVLTSSDAEHDILAAYGLYANCYLRKPVELDAFLATIRLTLEFWLNVARIPNASL